MFEIIVDRDSIKEGKMNIGNLNIYERTLQFTSPSDEKVYDGKPLTNDKMEVKGLDCDGFAHDEGVTFNVTGTQTDPGESNNDYTYTWNENTKSTNYIIKLGQRNPEKKRKNNLLFG